MALTDNYMSLNVQQLKKLLDTVEDEGKEIRVWVEEINSDGNTYLQGRRLCGLIDDPNDKFCCLVAGLYEEGKK